MENEIDNNSNVTTLPSTSYKPQPVMDFLETVFHSELLEGEEILAWSCSKIPGYPISEDALEQKLRRGKKHQAFYYGTSTCTRDTDGNLYNRKSLFSRLHVVVLDDIGTKIPRDSLPEGLVPTYIIESSEGNEQWGFVLDEPIDVLDHAQLFVTLVYHSGFTDTGGNMPTKLVRLPCGYNMKEGREQMPVTLLKSDGPLWSPDDLLKVLETGVTWAQIQTAPDMVKKKALVKTQGSTPWAGVHVQAPSVDGIIDSALEWLYTEGKVYQERDEWVDIRCPWHSEHTEADKDKAGYSPLGWGSDGAHKARGFNCFHDSCKGRHGQDFLEYVATHGGPELPVYEHVPELLTRFVYDRAEDGFWDLVEPLAVPQKVAALKNEFANPVRVVQADGKIKSVSPVALLLNNPARVKVAGAEYSPGHRSKLFMNERGHLKYNLFDMPAYEDRAIDESMTAPFYDYLDYLIPSDDERNFFLDWLACKVQDPTFRGPALFMVAEKQGIGRTTLMDILAKMFGHQNTKNVSFDELIAGGNFNAYLESLLVVVNETLALSDYASGKKSSDKLKELIDPRPVLTTINPKYGKQRDVWSVSSYVFLSNHIDGLKLTEGDRRYYAIRNAFERNTPEFYGAINHWMNGSEWQEHLWNSLLERDVDIEAMAAPPARSATMDEVIDASGSALDVAVEAFGLFWPTGLIPVRLGKSLITMLAGGNDMFPEKNRDFILRKVWKDHYPSASKGSVPMAVKGLGQYRFGIQSGDRLVNSDHTAWPDTRAAIEEYNEAEMAGKVMEYMEERGFVF